VPELLVVLAAGVAFALFVVVLGLWGQRSFSAYTARLQVRFPPPKQR
jgi:hypothetical protein